MLLREQLTIVATFCSLILLFPVGTDGQVPSSTTACPPAITTTELAEAPNGWSTEGHRSQHPFERISIYNGKPRGTEFELAPDTTAKQSGVITQEWHLAGYRTMNIFIRCRYHDTAVVLEKELPAQIQFCRLRFSLDSRGKIAGKSEMECR